MNSKNSFTLLLWYENHGRDLPWRHTKDPYAIWLSEVILQQTRIAQGIDYWYRFIERWPRVEMLATASEDEVLRMWQGLGYYSRARNLHQAAQQIVELGAFPHDIQEIRKLKGIGDYTASAIAAFAFDQPIVAADGNVYRVISRTEGIATPINSTEGKRLFNELAQSLMEPLLQHKDTRAKAPLLSQALMDFGATVCTPKGAKCEECPLIENCVAYREGRVEELPVKLKTVKIKERYLTYILIHCHGEIAIHQRGKGDIWQGLWEPLLFESNNFQTADENGENILSDLSAQAQSMRLVKSKMKHALTHRIIWADFYEAWFEQKPQLPKDYIWIAEEKVDDYAMPRIITRVMEEL